MSLSFYCILIFIFPNLSIGLYRYDLVRNATIKLPFDIDDYSMNVSDCNACLCEAFQHPDKILLFTCTEKSMKSYRCQFYSVMPYRDEIDSPVNDTNIYIMTNDPFKSKDECCNTSLLVAQLRITTASSNSYSHRVRTIVNGDNNQLVVVNAQDKKIVWFDRNNLTKIREEKAELGVNNVKSIGYAKQMYYVAFDRQIGVYAENFTMVKLLPYSFPTTISVIYFLSENQLLVGTVMSGAFICERNDTHDFNDCKGISGSAGSGQVHGFYGINQTAFYTGWTNSVPLQLYIKQADNTWKVSTLNAISRTTSTGHLAIDNCQRIWAVQEAAKKISIYSQSGMLEGEFDLPTPESIFSLLILDQDNYTLITTNENPGGLFRVKPDLNCLNRCNKIYPIESNDWRPLQDLLITRFHEVDYSENFRTINQDYGSFYYNHSQSHCIPDKLKEKILTRHETFMNYLAEQPYHQPLELFCQPTKQAIKVTHRKKYPCSPSTIHPTMINYYVKQIHERIKDLVEPKDLEDVQQCIRMLVFDFLSQNPSLSSDDLINHVLNTINTS